MGGAGMPSNALTGTLFQVDGSGPTGPITVPYGNTQLRFWRNTSVANTAPGQTATLASDLLGYEWDSSPDNGFQPVGLVDLSSTTVTTSLLQYCLWEHRHVRYCDAQSRGVPRPNEWGARLWSRDCILVVGTCLTRAMSNTGGNPLPPDPNVQQAMVNLFADMGVQPSTLQATLTIATQTTDHTPPASNISNVSTTTPVEGQMVTVTGTATDAGGGVIAGVDVSTDGGKTWNPANSPVGAVKRKLVVHLRGASAGNIYD